MCKAGFPIVSFPLHGRVESEILTLSQNIYLVCKRWLHNVLCLHNLWTMWVHAHYGFWCRLFIIYFVITLWLICKLWGLDCTLFSCYNFDTLKESVVFCVLCKCWAPKQSRDERHHPPQVWGNLISSADARVILLWEIFICQHLLNSPLPFLPACLAHAIQRSVQIFTKI